MKTRAARYWTTTILIALAFLSGGAAYLLRVEANRQGMAALGYPADFVTILGAWKLAGAATILATRLGRLKEWAYAGIAFDLSGAATSHIAIGHGAGDVIAPLALLAVAMASWSLRPASRRLDAGAAPGGTRRGAAPSDPRRGATPIPSIAG